MNTLLAGICVAVLAATGYHFLGQYRTARHAVECDTLIADAERFSFMVKVGHSEFADQLRESTQKVVAAHCALRRMKARRFRLPRARNP